MKKQGPFFKFLRKTLSFFYRKTKFIGLENIPKEPSIIVGNHAQIHGPFIAELQMPFKKNIWCAGEMLDKNAIPDYAMKDFWPYKPKRVRWFYKGVSKVVAAPLLSYIYNRVDVIPVYHDNRVILTFKRTVECLKKGAHIVIFPEYHKPFNQIIYEFQQSFVEIARLFFKNTGKRISFVPMYNAPKLKTVVFGKPIEYDQKIDIVEQKNSICNYLKNEITSLAKSLPVHKVVPYANIPKKQWNLSR